MAITKEELLAFNDIKVTEVEVPILGEGVTVFVKELSGADMDSYQNFLLKKNKDGEFQDVSGLKEMLIVKALCDENGKRMFTDSQVSDLSKKSQKLLDYLYEKVNEVNAVTEEAIEDAKKN